MNPHVHELLFELAENATTLARQVNPPPTKEAIWDLEVLVYEILAAVYNDRKPA